MFAKLMNRNVTITVAQDAKTLDGGASPNQYIGTLIADEGEYVVMDVNLKKSSTYVYINKKYITTISLEK